MWTQPHQWELTEIISFGTKHRGFDIVCSLLAADIMLLSAQHNVKMLNTRNMVAYVHKVQTTKSQTIGKCEMYIYILCRYRARELSFCHAYSSSITNGLLYFIRKVNRKTIFKHGDFFLLKSMFLELVRETNNIQTSQRSNSHLGRW